MAVRASFVETWLVCAYVFATCIPGRLRLVRDSYHFGGGELALIPTDLPLLAWLTFFVLRGGLTRVRVDTPFKVAALYVLASLAMLPFSSLPVWSLYEIVRIAKYFLAFVLFRHYFESRSTLGAFHLILVAVVALQASAAIAQYATGTTVSGLNMEAADLNVVADSVFRLVGTFGHPGVLAQYLTVIFPMIALGLYSDSKRLFYAAAVAAAASVCLIVLSQSRVGIVVISLTVLMLYLVRMAYLQKATQKLMVTAVLVVTITSATFVLWDYAAARFIQQPDESSVMRLLLTDIAFRMFVEHPVFGVGLNTFAEVMQAYDVHGVSYYFPHPVHNIYLLTLSETGLVGLAVFIAINVYYVVVALKDIKAAGAHAPRRASLYWLMSLSVIYITGLLGWAWRQDSIQALYWICLAGLATAYVENRARRNFH